MSARQLAGLAEQRALAAARGGVLLSTSYSNNRTKLWYRDAGGHRFQMRPFCVSGGQWSPMEGQVSEHVCRQAMEHLLSREFPSTWEVVQRPNGNRLQLDGYDPASKVAFEYQGFRHRTDQGTIERDKEKRAACAARGILLIEVEQFDDNKRMNPAHVVRHVGSSILLAYAEAGRQAPEFSQDPFVIDVSRINRSREEWQWFSDFADARGGRILSTTYINNRTPLMFEDAEGRQFPKWPSSVKRGSWSPYESGRVRHDPGYHMEELRRIAAARGGRVVSTEYVRGDVPMIFADAAGREFPMLPDNVKRGHWSPWESGNHRDKGILQAELKAVIEARGGEMESEYVNGKTHVHFKDASGNDCKLLPGDIKRGKWSVHETHLEGARRVRSEDGTELRVHLRSGDVVIYDLLPDGPRIREHRNPEGYVRTWDWPEEKPAAPAP